MKRIIIGIFAFIFIAIGALIAVALLTPKDTYKAKIETAVADALGREVALNGDVGLSFFPRISASIEDVTVANPEGFTGEHMIKAGALRGSVKWGPLFTGRVEVHEIAFIDANVDLEVLPDGRANWEFETAETETPAEPGSTGEINAGIDRARLVNAALTYRDGVAGTAYTLSDLNVEASIASLTEELAANGDGVFEGDAFSFDLTLDSPQAIIDGTEAAADVTFKMDLVDASFAGTATLAETPIIAGAFTATAPSIKALADYGEIDPASLPLALDPLGSLKTSGNVSGPIDALAIEFDALDVTGDALTIGYTGKATLTETPSVNGNLTLNLQNAAATINALGLDIPEAATLDGATLSLTSGLSGPSDAISASGIDMAIDGPLLNATYTGAAAVGTSTTVDGRLSLKTADLHRLVLASGIALEPSQTEPLKGAALDLTSSLSGPADAISASGIDLNLSGPLLNAAYKGDVSLAGEGTVNGTLSANSDQLRALLSAADVELTPGSTMQTFRVSGAASGQFDRLSINNLDMALDDITGKGNLLLRTDTPRPTLTGDLATGALDLTPFMGEAPEDAPQGWSKEPLALESLKTADIDISLASPSIKIDNVTLRDANLKAKLTNGVLDTNINQFSVFGGLWKGGIDLNTSGATPSLAINMTGDSILIEEIVKTFVGNDMMTGGGAFKVNLTARGNSLHAIMNSLNGELSANLADGAIKGMNIGQLIRTATDLRSNLSSGGNLLSNLAVSPSAQSDFSAFNTVLKINNGVADIEIMEILSSTFGANGLGEIGLGGQTIDMALRVAADTSARGELKDVQLNNVGIPLRITGSWTSPRIVPDTSVLTQLLAGQALDRFGNLIGGTGAGNGNVGDAVTDALSGVIGNRLGGGNNIPPPVNQAPTASEAANAADESEKEPETIEDLAKDAAKDVARDALGGLFGKRKKQDDD